MKILASIHACFGASGNGNFSPSVHNETLSAHADHASLENSPFAPSEKWSSRQASARCNPALRALLRKAPSASLPPPLDIATAQKRGTMAGHFVILGKLPRPLDRYLHIEPLPMSKSEFCEIAKRIEDKAMPAEWTCYETYQTPEGAKQVNDALRSGSALTTPIKLINGRNTNLHIFQYQMERMTTDIPIGTQFVRHIGTKGFGGSQDMEKLKEVTKTLGKAKKGLIMQEFGFMSTAVPGAEVEYIGLDRNEIRLDFTAGPGVKAALFDNTLGEALFMPNQRFAITQVTTQNNKTCVKATLLPSEHTDL